MTASSNAPYSYWYRPRSTEVKGVFVWFSAKNEKRADREILNVTDDNDLLCGRGQDYFLPVRTNFPVFNDLPAEGALDYSWGDRYELAEDGKTWMPIVSDKAPEADPEINVELKYLADLRLELQVASIWLHNDPLVRLNLEQVSEASALVMDDDSRFFQNTLLSITSSADAKVLQPEGLALIISAIKKVFPTTSKIPDLGTLCGFIKRLLTPTDEGHVDLVASCASVTNGTPSSFTTLDTPLSADDLSSEDTIYKREFPHTWQTLDHEIACALHNGDVDLHNISGAISREAKERMANSDDQWRDWSNALRGVPNVKQYSRNSIFALIRTAPEQIPNLQIYSLAWLADNGIWEDENLSAHVENTTLTTGNVEKQIEQPDIKNLGDGKFSIDGLESAPAAEQPLFSEREIIISKAIDYIFSGEENIFDPEETLLFLERAAMTPTQISTLLCRDIAHAEGVLLYECSNEEIIDIVVDFYSFAAWNDCDKRTTKIKDCIARYEAEQSDNQQRTLDSSVIHHSEASMVPDSQPTLEQRIEQLEKEYSVLRNDSAKFRQWLSLTLELVTNAVRG